METLFFIIYNFFGISSKIIASAIPYVMAFTMSSSAQTILAPQDDVPVEEPETSGELVVSPTPIFLEEDLLPEMTMTFSMGKNGEVLFVSSYGRTRHEPGRRASNKSQELLMNIAKSSNFLFRNCN